jgi:hypothetical protein
MVQTKPQELTGDAELLSWVAYTSGGARQGSDGRNWRVLEVSSSIFRPNSTQIHIFTVNFTG